MRTKNRVVAKNATVEGWKMTERTWRCTECRYFVYPNHCIVKGIKVDRNYDDYCDLAEEIEADMPERSDKEVEK